MIWLRRINVAIMALLVYIKEKVTAETPPQSSPPRALDQLASSIGQEMLIENRMGHKARIKQRSRPKKNQRQRPKQRDGYAAMLDGAF